ncbi:hypothetical protein J2808_000114 [Pseudarthrobacter sulfonivorans]|nr:hypothetical protein [Pseudarthrobacter sulfonivorans]
MTVSFVCRTASSLPRERLFDLARSIDAHVDSQKRLKPQPQAACDTEPGHIDTDTPRIGPIRSPLPGIVTRDGAPRARPAM